jgi:hypothetical protein
MMSRAPFATYFARYTAVFVVGVVCNIIGDAVGQRPEWYLDFGNTIFQMFYVVFIMVLSFCCWPLRSALRSEADPFGGGVLCCDLPERLACLCLYGGIFIGSYTCYLLGLDVTFLVGGLEEGGAWSAYIVDVFLNLFHIIAHSFGFATLVSLHVFLRRKPDGWLTWLLLAYIYVPVILFPSKMAYGPQMIMLYLLGFVARCFPFAGSEGYARDVRSYSVLIIVMLTSISMPELLGRCDIYPPLTMWERFRSYFLEAFLATVLLTGAVSASDPHGLLRPLGWWALIAFCTHVMLARILPTPFGAVVEYALIPIFIAGDLCLRRPVNRGDEGDGADGGGGGGGGRSPWRSQERSRKGGAGSDEPPMLGARGEQPYGTFDQPRRPQVQVSTA